MATDVGEIWAIARSEHRATHQRPSQSSLSRCFAWVSHIAVRAIEGETYWLILGGLVAANVGLVLMLVRS